MSKIIPYFSLDIETTGLNIDRAQILEIACIYDDGISPIDELPSFRRIISPQQLYPHDMYWEAGAMKMHSRLLEELANNTTNSSFFNVFHQLKYFITITNDKELSIPNLAGKNLAAFDLPIIQNHINHYNVSGTINYNDLSMFEYNHRVLDVGSLYFPLFGKNTSLDKIIQYIDSSNNTNEADKKFFVSGHTALGDCYRVIKAIRYAVKYFNFKSV